MHHRVHTHGDLYWGRADVDACDTHGFRAVHATALNGHRCPCSPLSASLLHLPLCVLEQMCVHSHVRIMREHTCVRSHAHTDARAHSACLEALAGMGADVNAVIHDGKSAAYLAAMKVRMCLYVRAGAGAGACVRARASERATRAWALDTARWPELQARHVRLCRPRLFRLHLCRS